MKNSLTVIIGLMFFSSVISIISPDKKNIRLVNIILVCYIFLILTGVLRNDFSSIVTDYSSVYDEMMDKINGVAETNNKLITEQCDGLE